VEQGDYLYIVDTTVSYTKLSPFIHKDAHYTVEMGHSGVPRRGDLEIVYSNRYSRDAAYGVYPDYYYRDFWDTHEKRMSTSEGIFADYVRVFVPAGATLLSASGFDADVEQRLEHGRSVFAGYVRVSPGEERRLRLEYSLPPTAATDSNSYSLLVQRQPGASAYRLTVMPIVPPEQYAVETDPETGLTRAIDQWKSQIDSDRVLTLAVQPAAGR
jgi:hypothetical protein